MKKIKTSAIWNSVQGTGRVLDNRAYRTIVNNHRRGSYDRRVITTASTIRINLKTVKEAYHSPDTKPECRAILFHSMFEPTEWLTNQYNYFRRASTKVSRVGLSLDRSKSGRLYFRFIDDEGRAIRLNSLMISGLQQRELRAPQSIRYVKALTSSGVKQQKVAFWAQEFNTCLFSLADVLVTTVFLTDPLNRFGSPPSFGDEDIPEESPETGSIEDKKDFRLRRYEQQLSNLVDQFQNYIPIANRLNIDTSGILENLKSLQLQIKDYNELEFHRDDLLDIHHELATQTVESIYGVARKVERMDLDDPILNKVAKNTAVPQFKDIEWRKQFHRTTTEGASSAIKNYAERMLKRRNWEFQED